MKTDNAQTELIRKMTVDSTPEAVVLHTGPPKQDRDVIGIERVAHLLLFVIVGTIGVSKLTSESDNFVKLRSIVECCAKTLQPMCLAALHIQPLLEFANRALHGRESLFNCKLIGHVNPPLRL